MSTLLELETRVKKIWKRDDADTTPVKYAINDTYKAMLSVLGHHKLQDRMYKDIIAEQFEISLPLGILRINHPIKLIDPAGGSEGANSYPLRFMTKAEYDDLEAYPEATDPGTGTPWGYALWKNSIYLTSIPDKAYLLEINMGGEPVDLLVDADASILSSVWDETIAAGALHRLFASVKLYTDSDYWRKAYLNGSEGDGNMLVGGLNLLRQLDRDNSNAVSIIKNQPL
jgi:hypothetical protein